MADNNDALFKIIKQRQAEREEIRALEAEEALQPPVAPPNDSGLLSPEELSEITARNAEKAKYETIGQLGLTVAEGVGRGVSFGGTDVLGNIAGQSEEMAKRAEINPVLSTGAEISGIVATSALSGGTSAVAGAARGLGGAVNAVSKAGLALEKSAALQFAKEVGSKKIAAEIISKGLTKGLGSAVEGAAYGGGHLISESALGNAEFNGENLLSYMSMGALYSGVIGGALGSAGAAAKGVANKVTSTKVGGKLFTTPKQAVYDLLGMTEANVAKATNINKEFGDDAVNYLTKDLELGTFTSTDKLLKRNRMIKQEAGQEIDDLITTLDANSTNKLAIDYKNAAVLPTKSETFNKVAQRLDDNIISAYEGVPGFEAIIKKVKKYRNEFLTASKQPGTVGVKELQTLRQQADELAYQMRILKSNKSQEAAVIARGVFRQTIDDVAERINPNLAAKLKDANRRYYMSSTVEGPLTRKAGKSNSFEDFKGMFYTGLGYAFGDTIGMTIGAASRFIESDVKKRMTVLASIEKANRKANSAINEGVKNFFNGAKSKFVPASTVTLLNSSFTKNEQGDGKKPESKSAAVNNLKKNISRITTDPEYAETAIMSKFLKLSQVAPETAGAAMSTFLKAVEFLDLKLPKDAESATQLYGKPQMYSDYEVSKLSRYLQVIENPLSAIKDLEAGALTREHVEALKAVYPDIYGRVVTAAMDMISKNQMLPYNRRVQLSMLLDIPGDYTLTPDFILARQAIFATDEQGGQTAAQGGVAAAAVKPTVGGLKQLSKDSTYKSNLEDVSRGEFT